MCGHLVMVDDKAITVIAMATPARSIRFRSVQLVSTNFRRGMLKNAPRPWPRPIRVEPIPITRL